MALIEGGRGNAYPSDPTALAAHGRTRRRGPRGRPGRPRGERRVLRGELQVGPPELQHERAHAPRLVRMRWRSACNPGAEVGAASSCRTSSKAGNVKIRGRTSLRSSRRRPGTQFQSSDLGRIHASQLTAATRSRSGRNPATTPPRSRSEPCGEIALPEPKSHTRRRPRKPYNIAGTTEIIARSSALGLRVLGAEVQLLEIDHLSVVILDMQPPRWHSARHALATGAVGFTGSQPLNYDASDNIGIVEVDAKSSGGNAGSDGRPCALAIPGHRRTTAATPCPNGGGQIMVDTGRLHGGNAGARRDRVRPRGQTHRSAPVTCVSTGRRRHVSTLAVQGGDAWRTSNGFYRDWTERGGAGPSADRRGELQALPRQRGQLCRRETKAATGSRACRSPFRHRRVAAQPGGETPPEIRRTSRLRRQSRCGTTPTRRNWPSSRCRRPIRRSSPSDVVDASQAWRPARSRSARAARASGSASDAPGGRHLVARLDDATLPAGAYVLRATAFDQARNQAIHFGSQRRPTDGAATSLCGP